MLNKFVPSPLKEPDICPVVVNAPVISVFELILKPFAEEMDAVATPSAIRVKLSPVTPLEGILKSLDPSPLIEPEMVPSTLKSPEISPEPDTDREPDM
jgi:hypothetical protein